MLGTRVGVVCAVAAFVLVGVGCGGDDDDSSSGATKSEFIKQADAVCKDFNARDPEACRGPSRGHVASGRRRSSPWTPRCRCSATRSTSCATLDVPAADADQVQQMWDDLDVRHRPARAEAEGRPGGRVLRGLRPVRRREQGARRVRAQGVRRLIAGPAARRGENRTRYTSAHDDATAAHRRGVGRRSRRCLRRREPGHRGGHRPGARRRRSRRCRTPPAPRAKRSTRGRARSRRSGPSCCRRPRRRSRPASTS